MEQSAGVRADLDGMQSQLAFELIHRSSEEPSALRGNGECWVDMVIPMYPLPSSGACEVGSPSLPDGTSISSPTHRPTSVGVVVHTNSDARA